MTNDQNLDISNSKLKIENYIRFNIKNFLRDLIDLLIRRNLYSLKYKNFFKKQKYQIDLVLPSRGFSDDERKKKLNSIKKIEGKKILCIGCGNGFELLSWLKFKPSYIKAIDILNYKKSWERINDFIIDNNIKTKIVFSQKDLLDLDETKKFDFIVSDAVFEHLIRFEDVINFSKKLLNDDGVIYASYGPLWFNFAGDHFSGRDNKKNGYNHLLLSENEYFSYYEKNVGDTGYEIENQGSGGLFVKEDLFSKKKGNEYMEIYKKNNLISEYTVLEFCPIGYKLIKTRGRIKDQILEKHPNLDIEDCYLKTQIVYLKKNIG